VSLIDLMRHIQQSQFCERDGFPLVLIDGQHYCSAEYADGLIGGQQVLGVAQADQFVELLLANGYVIPLTCPCCGGALHLRELRLPELRALLIGRKLEGFRHGEWVGQELPPKRHSIFALQFSGDEERGERTIEVGLESVRRIRRARAGTSEPA
jgi:hypothetical protein